MNDKCHPGHHTVSLVAYRKFRGLSGPVASPALVFCKDCSYRSNEPIDFRYTNERRGYCRSAVKCPPGNVFVTEEAYIKGKLMGAW